MQLERVKEYDWIERRVREKFDCNLDSKYDETFAIFSEKVLPYLVDIQKKHRTTSSMRDALYKFLDSIQSSQGRDYLDVNWAHFFHIFSERQDESLSLTQIENLKTLIRMIILPSSRCLLSLSVSVSLSLFMSLSHSLSPSLFLSLPFS